MTVSTPKNFRLTRAFDWLKQGDGCELSRYCKELTKQRGLTKETDISCQSIVNNLQSNLDRKKLAGSRRHVSNVRVQYKFCTATARLTQEAAMVSVQDSTQQQQPLVFDAGFHTQGCQCRILHSNRSRCVFDSRMSMQDSTQGCQCRILHSNRSRCTFDSRMSMQDSTQGCQLRILHSNRSRCTFDTGRCEGVRAGLSDGTAEVLAEAEKKEELDGVVAVGPVQQN